MKNALLIISLVLSLLAFMLKSSDPNHVSNLSKEEIEKRTLAMRESNSFYEKMAPKTDSVEVLDEKGKFKIVFPVRSIFDTTFFEKINNVDKQFFVKVGMKSDMMDPNEVYKIDYMYFPNISSKEDIRALFDQQIENYISLQKFKLQFEKRIETDTIIGRVLLFKDLASKVKVNYRMYFKNGILYRIYVVMNGKNHLNKYSTGFFDSFLILD